MSKTERKAWWKAECEARDNEAKAQRLAEDLERLQTLRRELVGRRDPEAYKLICAIDDYAGHLCGDRTVFHAKAHSIP